jgi:hypothetical protein
MQNTFRDYLGEESFVYNLYHGEGGIRSLRSWQHRYKTNQAAEKINNK